MKTLYKVLLFIILSLSASTAFGQQSETEKGIEFYNQGEYQKAVETLQKLVEAKDKKALVYLGMSYAKLKNKSQASKFLKKADKIADKDADTDSNSTKIVIQSKPRATYTDEARQNQVQGVVKLAVEFGADGTIKAVVPFQTLPNGITENCVAAAKGIKFTPATRDGKPYSAIKVISYSFTIY